MLRFFICWGYLHFTFIFPFVDWVLTFQVQIFLPCIFGSFHGQSPERNHKNSWEVRKKINSWYFKSLLLILHISIPPLIHSPHRRYQQLYASLSSSIFLLSYLSKHLPWRKFWQWEPSLWDEALLELVLEKL